MSVVGWIRSEDHGGGRVLDNVAHLLADEFALRPVARRQVEPQPHYRHGGGVTGLVIPPQPIRLLDAIQLGQNALLAGLPMIE
ncbi:MAG: hypothetical protein Q9187_009600, partial [Circinaria calcarea]